MHTRVVMNFAPQEDVVSKCWPPLGHRFHCGVDKYRRKLRCDEVAATEETLSHAIPPRVILMQGVPVMICDSVT